MLRIIAFMVLAVLAFAGPSYAAITCTSTDFNTGTGSASTQLQITETVPTATYRRSFLAIQNRSNITDTINSVSDTGSGTWTARQGPTDNVNYRIWFYDRDGGSDGSITVTVAFSGSINSSGVFGTCTSDTADITYQSSATVATYTTAGGATVTSSTRTVSNTGIIVSDQQSSGNSTVSSMGTNSTAMNTASLPTHIGIRSESSGTYDVTFTLGFAVNGMIGAHLYQEAAATGWVGGLGLLGAGR